MGRPIYNYELSDPDFSWLVSNFKENNPSYNAVEASGVPVVFIGVKPTLQIHEANTPSGEEFEVQPNPEVDAQEQLKSNGE